MVPGQNSTNTFKLACFWTHDTKIKYVHMSNVINDREKTCPGLRETLGIGKGAATESQNRAMGDDVRGENMVLALTLEL